MQEMKDKRRSKNKPVQLFDFAGELAERAAEAEFAEWMRKHDPDPPRFTVERWPGATTRIECCLCDGFDWVCPAYKSQVDPVTHAPIYGGCNSCSNNQALRPIRMGRVQLTHEHPAPFIVGADRKLRAVCRACVERLSPWLEKQWQAATHQYYQERSDHAEDIPF